MPPQVRNLPLQSLPDSITDILGTDGPFAEHLDGFAPRAQQQMLGEAIQHLLDNGSTLICEAGTGVGKTFAYLVPALLSGLKIIISTGTKHLQDQLYHQDLPLVKKALRSDVSIALLKGRANYICRHRLAEASGHPALSQANLLSQLSQVRAWAKTTESGDISEMTDLPEDAPIWRYVVSDADYNSALEPEQLKDCFVQAARKAAQAADIVVVNHHLFFADLALKEEGFGEVLPSANAFILDEAHQIPEIATQFFGSRVSSRQLNDLVRDTTAEQLRDAPDMSELRDAVDALAKAGRDFRLSLGVQPTRDQWRSMADKNDVRHAIDELHTRYSALADQLEIAAERGKGLTACLRRCVSQLSVLDRYIDTATGNSWIQWFETFRNGYALSLTPLDVAEPFQRSVNALSATWVYTSATLSVGGTFDHFQKQLGIEDAAHCRQESPFDYQRNALLYLPEGLPQPSDRRFTEAALEAAFPVIQFSGGRTFFLFTSYRALHIAAEWLEDKLDVPMLVQGEAPKRELIAEFQALGNAVLLGTSSFWEGVDVRGQALSCVIIDKLPFASPGDPVMQARIDAISSSGGNAFFDYQVPQAAIALKQGVGRLIRDVQDWGLVMICDPRLTTKSYGKMFLNSLPNFPVTSSLQTVREFFERHSP
ncbi:MAG: ATP-dependent DNA helicase [Pseudomonadota bacterium]